MAEKAKNELYKKAQENLIASLIASTEGNSEVYEIVRPDDFDEPKYEMIFKVILDLDRKGLTTDIYSIAKVLEDEGNLAAVDNLPGLYQLYNTGKKVRRGTPIRVFAAILKETAAKNSVKVLIEQAQEIFENDSGVLAVDGISELQESLNDFQYRLSDTSTMVEVSDMIDDYADLISHREQVRIENEGAGFGLQGIPTLLPKLDKYTTGWKPAQMITVGAKTGVGKSAFAINCAVAAMQANKSVMFFSLEMSVEEIEDRIISSITSIPMSKFQRGELSDRDNEVMVEALKELKMAKLTIDVDPSQTIDTIRAKALRKAQSPEGLDFIVLDYLQLVSPSSNKNSNREQQVAEISRGMKRLSKVLQVPIMVLAQLNRDENDEATGLPSVDSIRESSAIAQDSDVIIFLDRPKTADEEIPHTRIVLAKQRNGAAGKVILAHSQLECSVFREVTSHKDIEEYSQEELDELNAELSEDDDFTDDDELGDF